MYILHQFANIYTFHNQHQQFAIIEKYFTLFMGEMYSIPKGSSKQKKMENKTNYIGNITPFHDYYCQEGFLKIKNYCHFTIMEMQGQPIYIFIFI